MRIAIQYPPDFDGELHIEATSNDRTVNPAFTFSFTHAAKVDDNGNPDAWSTLVAAAKAIVAQSERRK